MDEKAVYTCVDQEHDAWRCRRCGYIEDFEADGPEENGWHFCPGCNGYFCNFFRVCTHNNSGK